MLTEDASDASLLIGFIPDLKSYKSLPDPMVDCDGVGVIIEYDDSDLNLVFETTFESFLPPFEEAAPSLSYEDSDFFRLFES
jgi:hypothetical protein